MGILAVEGSYDGMYELMESNLPAVDLLLVMAAREGDVPKIEELLAAGADISVKYKGKTVEEWAGKNNPAKKQETVAALATKTR